MQECVVKHIAGEDAVIWRLDIEVELGWKHRAGKAAWMVLPVPQQDIWVLGGLNQLQEFSKDGGIGVGLYGFPCLQVDSCEENGAVSCLPKTSLVATSLTGVGFQWREATSLISQKEDSSMTTRVVLIGVSGDSKGSAATDGEVLASLLVLLGICNIRGIWVLIHANWVADLLLPPTLPPHV